MNYKRIYDEIIENAKSQNRKKNKGIYYEKHHIIPKCKGGTNHKSNLVLLTGREHFLAHKLLHKAYPDDRKLFLGYFCMCTYDNGLRDIKNSKEFDEVRKQFEELNKQRVYTQEMRDAISQRSKKFHEDNPDFKEYISLYLKQYYIDHPELVEEMSKRAIEYYKTHDHPAKGIKRGPMSDEQKELLSISIKKFYETHDGYWKTHEFSEEHKERISKALIELHENMTEDEKKEHFKNLKRGEDHHMFGKHHTEETKKYYRSLFKDVPLKEDHKKNISIGLKIFYDSLTDEEREIHIDKIKFKPERASEELMRYLSECKMGEKNSFFGKHHSEETKQTLKEYFGKGILYDGVYYESISECSRMIGKARKNIRMKMKKEIDLGNEKFAYVKESKSAYHNK